MISKDIGRYNTFAPISVSIVMPIQVGNATQKNAVHYSDDSESLFEVKFESKVK